MKDLEKEYVDPSTLVICLQCIGNEEVQRRLSDFQNNICCSFCKHKERTVSLGDVFAIVDPIYRRFFIDEKAVENEASPVEARSPDQIMQDLVEVSPDIGRALCGIGQCREGYRTEIHGSFPFYNSRRKYVKVLDGPHLEHKAWQAITSRIKYYRRFLDPKLKSRLEYLFNYFENEHCGQLTVEGFDSFKVFRARKAESISEAKSILKEIP